MKDFFANLCIIMSFTYVINYIMTHPRFAPRSALILHWTAGLAGGLLGILLMIYSVRINEMIIIDLRTVPLVLIAMFFGPLPALISGVMIGLGRVLFFDLNPASLAAGGNVLLVALVCGWVSTWKLKSPFKLTVMTLYAHLQTSAVIYLLMPNQQHFFWLEVMPAFWFAACLGSFVFYHFYFHLRRSNIAMSRLRNMATRDFLTGAGNARHFDTQLHAMEDQARQSRQPFSLLSIDIDYFKQVNDTYGHIAGDAVLKQVVTLLNDHAGPGDIVSRNGGEEFSILLTGLALPEAAAVAERIRLAIASHSFLLPDAKPIHITVSIGIASYPAHADELSELIKQADLALYRAKQQGRNRVCG
ncbi:diguanylate cyclase [Paenibacillus sp. 1P07SE]|uniref:diguanylate cyclase n=1 Tax=Paenibacillus sp. 1P07SE TaxID=3132209 RepID=UPI0039A4E5AC